LDTVYEIRTRIEESRSGSTESVESPSSGIHVAAGISERRHGEAPTTTRDDMIEEFRAVLTELTGATQGHERSVNYVLVSEAVQAANADQFYEAGETLAEVAARIQESRGGTPLPLPRLRDFCLMTRRNNEVPASISTAEEALGLFLDTNDQQRQMRHWMTAVRDLMSLSELSNYQMQWESAFSELNEGYLEEAGVTVDNMIHSMNRSRRASGLALIVIPPMRSFPTTPMARSEPSPTPLLDPDHAIRQIELEVDDEDNNGSKSRGSP